MAYEQGTFVQANVKSGKSTQWINARVVGPADNEQDYKVKFNDGEVVDFPEEDLRLAGDANRWNFGASLLFIQIFLLVIFGVHTTYRSAAVDRSASVTANYGMFQDVHVMIFIGFGFLMTFLRKYGYSSVGLNMMIGSVILQWGMLAVGIIHPLFKGHINDHKLEITPQSLILGDFAAGAVLISFGAVLGRVTPTQLLWMGIFEIPFYAINEYIGVDLFHAVDMGGSMFVHTFGAYFGLAVSWVLGGYEEDEEPDSESVYHSDMFAMIGTIFLWMFWPSFNGALSLEIGNSRERVIINTVLALCASCTTTFAISKMVNNGKFEMEHIQNATLAGGVAVGSSSDLVIGPVGAIAVGMVAGLISVLGYRYLSPWLAEKFGLEDTCGVHNLHGMPGILGAIGGSISAAAATGDAYGTNIAEIFTARGTIAAGGKGWTASEQGLTQFYTLLCTLGFSIFGGVLVGLFLRSSLFTQQRGKFQDAGHWLVPEHETPTYFAVSHGTNHGDVELEERKNI